MTITRTTLLDLPVIATGTESGVWGDITNNGLTEYLDIAIAGMSALTSANFTAGALTIETTEGTSLATNITGTSAQYAGFRVSSLATNSTITVGNTGSAVGRSYRIINADSTYTLTFKATGQTGITFQPGTSGLVAFNGTDYVLIGVVGPASATDNAVARFDGTTGRVIQNSAVTIADTTGDITTSGYVITAAGAAGTAAYTTSGDLNTGMFFPAADTIAFTEGGTEIMRIDSSGNVGIGTTSAGSKLDVKGTLRLSGSSSGYVGLAPAAAAGSTTYTLPSADGTSGQFLSTSGTGTLSWATASGGGGGGGTSVTVTQITATASQTTFTVSYTVGQLSVYLNGALLAAADYTATNGTAVVLTTGATLNDILTVVAYNSATQIIQGDTKVEVTDTGSNGTIAFTTDNSERMRITSAGNVGIGVTPSAATVTTLQVVSSAIRGSGAGGSYSSNVYYDGVFKYITTGTAQDHYQQDQQFVWRTAASGSAGGTITFTQILAAEKSKSLALEGATSQSGTGITFPATQSASTNANTLDDYEEGTWTPNQGAGLTVTGAFSSSGSYTKIGNLVYVRGYVQGATTVSVTSAGIISTNLPFTAGGAGGGGNATDYYVGATSGIYTTVTTLYANSAIAASPQILFGFTYTT